MAACGRRETTASQCRYGIVAILALLPEGFMGALSDAWWNHDLFPFAGVARAGYRSGHRDSNPTSELGELACYH